MKHNPSVAPAITEFKSIYLNSIIDIFTFYVCLFCSHIVVNIMEFDAPVIQVRGLASYKIWSNLQFST